MASACLSRALALAGTWEPSVDCFSTSLVSWSMGAGEGGRWEQGRPQVGQTLARHKAFYNKFPAHNVGESHRGYNASAAGAGLRTSKAHHSFALTHLAGA